MPDIKKGDLVKHMPTGEIYTVHLLREYVDGWYMSPTCWPALNVPLRECCALSAHTRLAWMAAAQKESADV